MVFFQGDADTKNDQQANEIDKQSEIQNFRLVKFLSIEICARLNSTKRLLEITAESPSDWLQKRYLECALKNLGDVIDMIDYSTPDLIKNEELLLTPSLEKKLESHITHLLIKLKNESEKRSQAL